MKREFVHTKPAPSFCLLLADVSIQAGPSTFLFDLLLHLKVLWLPIIQNVMLSLRVPNFRNPNIAPKPISRLYCFYESFLNIPEYSHHCDPCVL